MDEAESLARRAAFVEDFGVALEDLGLPRMAGRMLGYLLVCEPVEQSSRQLAQALQASKGSVSSATRLLIDAGIVDRVARPGERVDYFRLRPGVWTRIMRLRLARAARIHEVAERGIELLNPDDLAGYARIEELHDFYQFLEQQYEVLIERWERQRARRLREEQGDFATTGPQITQDSTGGAR
jgi:DNA-binding transcriptional regulator GbsR (MarR family)